MLEILAPAGNMECAVAAIANGADAIYLGLDTFSARQGADNFDETSLQTIVQKAHFCGVKVYVAMNTLVKDNEIDCFIATLLRAWSLGVDAVIVQDIFLGKWLKQQYPEIILHASTQAGICTLDGALLAKEYGFSRVVLARETPLKEIEKIAAVIETEVFVQGALCTAFSGQCYFSSFAGGNSGNRGRCKQPCRKLYAYDRNGNTEKNYALSLSDLCVGENIQKLIAAGVTSYKIEGRMRRAEYVAAAVGYYRQLVDGVVNTGEVLSDLRRTYNRGNYTKGLAFGQDKRLLSTAIQGHLGEKVGVVKVINGKYLVESLFRPQIGDAFKILRDGKEVAGAVYVKTEGKCFSITSKIRLKNGDGVFITTDTAVAKRLLSASKKGELPISLYCHEGERIKATFGDFQLLGNVLQAAQSRPLTVEDVQACFLKTDGLPVDIRFQQIDLQGNSFIPKSELNAFRREFYAQIAEIIAKKGNVDYTATPVELPRLHGDNQKTAIIATDFTGLTPDVAIYKSDEYSAPIDETFQKGNFEKYLYYPPFLTEADEVALEKAIKDCSVDGVYADNYAGLYFAKKHGIKTFAGTGFHIFNAVSLSQLLEEVEYYAVSKEANAEEMKNLVSDKAFVLSAGDIKVMDLCYCPFGKSCNDCDKKALYRLTDEGGRVFPVKRYLTADKSCRFEVYNCASLIGTGVKGAGQLLDLSITEEKSAVFAAKDNEIEQKKVFESYTSGHYKRGVL